MQLIVDVPLTTLKNFLNYAARKGINVAEIDGPITMPVDERPEPTPKSDAFMVESHATPEPRSVPREYPAAVQRRVLNECIDLPLDECMRFAEWVDKRGRLPKSNDDSVNGSFNLRINNKYERVTADAILADLSHLATLDEPGYELVQSECAVACKAIEKAMLKRAKELDRAGK